MSYGHLAFIILVFFYRYLIFTTEKFQKQIPVVTNLQCMLHYCDILSDCFGLIELVGDRAWQTVMLVCNVHVS